MYYIQRATEHCKMKSIAFSCGILLILGLLHSFGVQTGNHTIVFGGVIFPCILLLVLQIDILGKVLSFPPFVYLGKISFSIYLCNYPIEIFLALLNEQFNLQINFSSPFLFLWYIPLHILIATVFWKIFEEIIPRQLKNKYLSDPDQT